MALPQKVIEQLGREPARTPGWSGRLLMFSSAIFFIAAAVYVGIVYGNQPFLESQLGEVSNRMNALAQEIPADDQTKIFTFYSQIANIKTLLGKHVITSRLFEWLERQTSANVSFNRFAFTRGRNEAVLSGVAKTVDDFIQQVQVFQAQSEVKSVNFKNLSVLEKGGWQFDMTLEFSPDFFEAKIIAPAPASPERESSESPQDKQGEPVSPAEGAPTEPVTR
ncbi:MAG: hypothetical protein AAB759_00600 [Patescibacteria group bacterium]